MSSNVNIVCADCFDFLRTLPESSVDLILTDPPYNNKVTTQRNNKRKKNEWDNIPNYEQWFLGWLSLALRALKPNGVFYFWHNDFLTLSRLVVLIQSKTTLKFNSFCIWDKGESYRFRSWGNRSPEGATAPRSWFNRCEYCVEFFNTYTEKTKYTRTGWEALKDDPRFCWFIKDWYRSELSRLGLDLHDIREMWKEETGRGADMIRHYFRDNQFEIPTARVFASFFERHGFTYPGGYSALRKTFLEEKKKAIPQIQKLENKRNYHRCDRNHCNVWRRKNIKTNNRLHTFQKPVDILERIVRTSCRPGGIVLDPFAGSCTTAAACIRTGRDFVGCEREEKYLKPALRWIRSEQENFFNP